MSESGIEIERKFVADAEFGLSLTDGIQIVQGYLASETRSSVRVRLIPSQGLCTLTVKGPRAGPARRELEEEISFELGELLLEACGSRIIEKTRHNVFGDDGQLWVIDAFGGRNFGLVMAEIELDSPEASFLNPPWLGVEVTEDARYYNEYISENPYDTWAEY